MGCHIQSGKCLVGEVISKEGLKQLRITETEKWVYLTKIFNGLNENAFEGEDRILIPSDKVATYDLKPEMKVKEITETVMQKLSEETYDLIVINYANPDILGHTADKEAIVKGVETIDNNLEKLLKKVLYKNLLLYNFLVTIITLLIFFGIFFLGSLLILAIGFYISYSANADATSLGAILLTIVIPLVIGILDLALCLFILIVNLKFKSPVEDLCQK